MGVEALINLRSFKKLPRVWELSPRLNKAVLAAVPALPNYVAVAAFVATAWG